MANQQQKRRADKLAKRAQKSKAKVKAIRRKENVTNAWVNRMDNEQADRLKHRSIYDILGDADELKARRKEGKTATEFMDNLSLFEGINDMINMVVKLHSGVAVYQKLLEEKRFEIPEAHRELTEQFERLIVEFNEDVSVVTTLDRAGKQPIDYPEIVLHLTDVMHRIMLDFRAPVITMLETQKEPIEIWATEHKPTELAVFDYMFELHDERLQKVMPEYATGASADLLKELMEMDAMMKAADPENDDLDDLENLGPVTIDQDPIDNVVAPNDPITEAKAQ